MNIELFGNRRTFLKLAALLAPLGALLASGGPAAAAPKRPEPEPGPSGQGYRLTEQVKKYYETARLS